MENLDLEIQRVTIELNIALKELEEEGNGFLDKQKIDKVFSTNKKLTDLIKQKNSK